MSDTPRVDAATKAAIEHGTGDVWFVAMKLERELTAANERIKRLGREVELLRLYGNKDCTAQADEVLKKEAKP